jgi:hypothetical protein
MLKLLVVMLSAVSVSLWLPLCVYLMTENEITKSCFILLGHVLFTVNKTQTAALP